MKSASELEPKAGRTPVIAISVLGLILAIAGAVIAVQVGKRDSDSDPDPVPASKTSIALEAETLPEATTEKPAAAPLAEAEPTPPASPPDATTPQPQKLTPQQKRRLSEAMQYYSVIPIEQGPRSVHWFGGIPSQLFKVGVNPGPHSNIRREDYAGAESCKECHAKNYGRWTSHAHRRMNAWATEENVVGDFTGSAGIQFMGGRGTFFRTDGSFRMKLERDGVVREFAIARTLGSRFFQYYIGTIVDGPEPEGHALRKVDHVLPFGYWIEPAEWVPIVNVGEEGSDSERPDPFVTPSTLPYDRHCSACHTTRAVGDLFMYSGMMERFDAYGPRVMHFSIENYLDEEHPELVAHLANSPQLTTEQMVGTLNAGSELPAKSHAVNLGISCEACHNGAAEHAKNEKILPSFFPRSEHLVIESKEDEHSVWGRTDTNINWVCSRCHAGNRPRYANGTATWNSTELSDAARGSCYDPAKAKAEGMKHLTCVHCHEPHTGTGQKWSRTAQQDNASCIDCHGQFSEAASLEAHTHHPAASTGSECMSCHMPRINEGLQDLVRTHTIFSPTNSEMLKADQPNACNMCHVEETVGWTKAKLKEWYDAEDIPQADLAESSAEREKAAVLRWLENEHHGTRLVAADSLTRQNARWAVEHIVAALDDPYLINRQFGARGLEKMTGINPRDHGYRFYMFKEERAGPLEKLRKVLLESSTQGGRRSGD